MGIKDKVGVNKEGTLFSSLISLSPESKSVLKQVRNRAVSTPHTVPHVDNGETQSQRRTQVDISIVLEEVSQRHY